MSFFSYSVVHSRPADLAAIHGSSYGIINGLDLVSSFVMKGLAFSSSFLLVDSEGGVVGSAEGIVGSAGGVVGSAGGVIGSATFSVSFRVSIRLVSFAAASPMAYIEVSLAAVAFAAVPLVATKAPMAYPEVSLAAVPLVETKAPMTYPEVSLAAVEFAAVAFAATPA